MSLDARIQSRTNITREKGKECGSVEVRIGSVDIARIRDRQARLKETMRAHHVRHPTDLPVRAILEVRADRLGGRP